MFDEQDAASIGAIAIAPSADNVIWVGTGEAFIRSNVSIGNGVYRSTDGGTTWEHKGLSATGRIVRPCGPLYPPNSIPWANGSSVLQLTVLVCRRM